jgi:hypothetical protein
MSTVVSAIVHEHGDRAARRTKPLIPKGAEYQCRRKQDKDQSSSTHEEHGHHHVACAADDRHRVGPFFGFFGVGYVLYCAGQATKRMGASVFAALLRAAIAVLGGLAAVWFNADVTWSFIAVALGMIAFGLFALPPLVTRSAYK